MQQPLLELTAAKKFWQAGGRKIPIIEDAALQIYAGESVAIMGPSGAGKSTLMHILAFLTPLDQGEIRYCGRNYKTGGRRGESQVLREISFIFQDAKLIPGLSVVDNVAVPLVHRGMAKKERLQRIDQVLTQVALDDRSDHLPNQLSGGETIRVAIARALVTRPKVIFADEPTGSLDSKMGGIVSDLIFSLTSPQTGVVVVTHARDVARKADRVLYMRDGRIQADIW